MANDDDPITSIRTRNNRLQHSPHWGYPMSFPHTERGLIARYMGDGYETMVAFKVDGEHVISRQPLHVSAGGPRDPHEISKGDLKEAQRVQQWGRKVHSRSDASGRLDIHDSSQFRTTVVHKTDGSYHIHRKPRQ